jgi:hypothetical protein
VPGRGKRSRSVREDHGTLDVRRQVSSRHSINLWVIDVCYGGRWGSYDAAPRASTRVPRADRWTRSMVSDDLIYIRQCLLRSRSFYRTLHLHPKIVQGIPVVTSTLRPLAGASSLSSSTTSPNQGSSDDYPEIGISACGDSAEEGHLIFMAAPNGDPSHNSSSRYPNIGRSKVSDAQTPNDGMI